MPHRSIALVFALLAVTVQALALAVSPVNAHDTVTGTPAVTIRVGTGLSDREVHVLVGAIVRFRNAGDERHRFRSRNGEGFDTGEIEAGESAQIRVSPPGTYTYIDERDDGNARYHGRIVVGSGSTAGGASTGDSESTSGAGARAGGSTAGCGSSAGGGATGGTGATGGGATATKKTATVTIGDRVFQPATTRISVGGTVTFRNGDGDEHTATGGVIDSGPLGPGASYEQTFAKAGTYDFLCIFHTDMQGTIEVIGAAVAAPKPTTTPAPTPTAQPATTRDTAIEIVDLAFDPPALEVPAGTTVSWTNTGVAPHTVTAKDGSFDSGTLESGATFEQRSPRRAHSPMSARSTPLWPARSRSPVSPWWIRRRGRSPMPEPGRPGTGPRIPPRSRRRLV